MDQRQILGVLALLVIAAFILSSAARKAIRILLYLLSVASFGLALVCIYAITKGNSASGSGSAGLLIIIVGAVFFTGVSIGAFKYALGLTTFEKVHFDVHDHVALPIPIPAWIKDTFYILSGIQIYFLFFASSSFYRQNTILFRDAVFAVAIPIAYLSAVRVARLRRPLEGTSRAKESLFFSVTVALSALFIVSTALKITSAQISFVHSGIEITDQTQKGGFVRGTPLDKDLKKAILADDAARVEQLITEGASLKARDRSLETAPLLLALSRRKSRAAEALIKGGAPVGETELAYAIVNVDASAIRFALSKQRILPKNCKECVRATAQLGDAELSAYLLDQLAQSDDLKEGVYQKAIAVLLTMPHWDEAKKAEYSKTYDFLIAKGAKPEILIDGYLPLHSFATQMHLYSERFVFLKEKRANLNAQDKDGNTYLHLAARGTSSNYGKLLELGLDPEIKNNAGESPNDLMAKMRPN